MNRLVCQFGLPRSGLYAVADWYMDGIGGVWQHSKGAGLKQIEANGPMQRFVTLEALHIEEMLEGINLCQTLGATFWVQLRDPYNWLSSLQQGVADLAVAWQPSKPLDRWKEYARHCRDDATWLSYNSWFGDPAYRRELSGQFGFLHGLNGEPWQYVPKRGGGSSFDREQYAGRAQEMAVAERYRRFVDEHEWRVQFDDEVIALAEQLFGMKRPW